MTPSSCDDGRVQLLGAPLDPVDLETVLARVENAIATGTRLEHACVNAAKVCRVQDDTLLRDALWRSGIVTADGQPVVWAARLLGTPVPERVAGIDLMQRLLAAAERRGHRVYLLGATAEVLRRAEDAIRTLHPQLRLAGSQHGYFAPEDEDGVVAAIAASRSDLLFVALDTPRKEIFLDRNRERLGVPFAMGVGGAFDILAGRRRRAPAWAQRLGLEWLFRLVQEPRRLAGRYVVGNARFVRLVAGELRSRRRAADSMRTILFVGPALSERGGIASAMAQLVQHPPAGYRVAVVASTGGATPMRKAATTLVGLVHAAELLARRRVSIVHLHASRCWSFRRKLLFYALARLFGRPVVWEIHSGRFEEYVRSLGRVEHTIVAHALRHAQAVAFLSEGTRDRLVPLLGLENAVVVRHAVPGLVLPPADERVVLALGDVGDAKGSFLLLHAFARVRRSLDDARLVLAGGGELARARAEARRLGIEQSVELPGWTEGEAKRRLLARCAVLAHPSPSEALPMAVLEALAAGRPVVATRVGALAEVIFDGENGHLVDPGDEAALAAALERVLADEEHRRALADGARGSAVSFEPAAVAADFAKLYAAA